MNHSYEASFVWDEPAIISYKPQYMFDTLQTVWQVFTLFNYKVYVIGKVQMVLHGLQIILTLLIENKNYPG